MIGERWRFFKNPWVIVGSVLSLVVILGLGMFVAQVMGYLSSIKSGDPNPFARDQLQASVARALANTPAQSDLARLSAGQNPQLGNPEARIRIVEFLDYECPFCRRTAPELRTFMSRHPDDVLLILRDFPLESIHPRAMDAAIAARCVFRQGDANRFWAYHDALFAHQDALEPEDLRAYAESVGASLPQFDSCVKQRLPEPEIRASIEDGLAAGARGTPTFFFNSVRVPGALDLAAIETIVETIKKEL